MSERSTQYRKKITLPEVEGCFNTDDIQPIEEFDVDCLQEADIAAENIQAGGRIVMVKPYHAGGFVYAGQYGTFQILSGAGGIIKHGLYLGKNAVYNSDGEMVVEIDQNDVMKGPPKNNGDGGKGGDVGMAFRDRGRWYVVRMAQGNSGDKAYMRLYPVHDLSYAQDNSLLGVRPGENPAEPTIDMETPPEIFDTRATFTLVWSNTDPATLVSLTVEDPGYLHESGQYILISVPSGPGIVAPSAQIATVGPDGEVLAAVVVNPGSVPASQIASVGGAVVYSLVAPIIAIPKPEDVAWPLGLGYGELYINGVFEGAAFISPTMPIVDGAYVQVSLSPVAVLNSSGPNVLAYRMA